MVTEVIPEEEEKEDIEIGIMFVKLIPLIFIPINYNFSFVTSFYLFQNIRKKVAKLLITISGIVI